MITILIEGQPIAQPRARITTRGKFAHAYTPKDHPIHAYRQAIQLQAKAAMAGQPPIEGPAKVSIAFEFTRPKSHTEKRREDSRHSQKPDIDNLIKAVFDSLNEVCFRDDSQICELSVTKRWVEGQANSVVVIEALQ